MTDNTTPTRWVTTPTRWVKKPCEIEAMQWTDPVVGHAICGWMEANGYPALLGNALYPDDLRAAGHRHDAEPPTAGHWIRPGDGALMIRTLEGDMRVSPDDYVIHGVAGEFYPCKPDIFTATYDEATDR